MKAFPVGSPVKITVPFVDLNGVPVTPTAVAYEVRDEEDTLLVSGTLAFTPGDTDVDLIVPAQHNNATGTAGRSVVVTLSADGGEIPFDFSYLLRGQLTLKRFENTIATYMAANVVAEEMPKLDAWRGASIFERQQAMIEAFRRLSRLTFQILWPQIPDMQSRLSWRDHRTIRPVNWPFMTDEIWANYPRAFQTAMVRAQVCEANAILTVDVYAEKREAGVLSETIGESSIMFQATRPLSESVSRETLRHLQGYLYQNRTIARA